MEGTIWYLVFTVAGWFLRQWLGPKLPPTPGPGPIPTPQPLPQPGPTPPGLDQLLAQLLEMLKQILRQQNGGPTVTLPNSPAAEAMGWRVVGPSIEQTVPEKPA